MGQPKALIELEGESFLARTTRVLREGGCDAVWVVAGPPGDVAAERVAAEAERRGAVVVRNPEADSEQVESLRLAVAALPPVTVAVVFTPVDHPRLPVEAVRGVIEAFRTTGAPVVVPTHGGTHGHPTLFAATLFAELAGELPDGARTLVHRHQASLVEVPVAGEGVLLDVNTPEELRAALG
jgi:CTP:molybdopterin cytidylyltransferase MocA